jgi:hypothetical protein
VELYERQLERLEADYGKAVVRQLFSLLWASRRGLHADAELRVAMAQASFEVDAYAELMLVIEEKLLICRGGDPLGCARTRATEGARESARAQRRAGVRARARATEGAGSFA